MENGTRALRRAGLLAAGLLLVGTAGCTAGQEAVAPVPAGVEKPLDAAGVDTCGLISREAAQAVGLDPVGSKAAGPDAANPWVECTWTLSGAPENAVRLMPDAKGLQFHYDRKATIPDFQELTIAGHPALRATPSGSSDDFCQLVVATSDTQTLTASTITRATPQLDPCALGQKALEAAVPSIPPAE